MAIVDQKRPVLPVPYAMELPDRVRKERYYDPDFFQLEAEQLWSRTWQMACRLEEIPRPHDFVEYRSSTSRSSWCAPRTAGVTAFQNACRHRGVQVAEGRGTCESGFTCPFHGWCYGPDGKNTFVPQRSTFSEHNLQPGDLDLRPVRCETWGGCAWINLDDDAPPLRAVHRAVRHDPGRLEARVDARRVVVRLPPARELEARRRGVHRAVPRPRGAPAAASIPGRFPPRDPADVRPAARGSTPRSATSTP